MTTYVGRDVTINIGGTPVTKVQELSFEIDNGQIDVRQVSTDTVEEFKWTKIAVSGTMTIRPESTGTYSVQALFNYVLPSNALPTAQPTDAITLEYGTGPDFTLSLTAVSWGTLSSSVAIEDPVEFELPFTGITATVA